MDTNFFLIFLHVSIPVALSSSKPHFLIVARMLELVLMIKAPFIECLQSTRCILHIISNSHNSPGRTCPLHFTCENPETQGT